MSAAEAIANVVADIKHGRISIPGERPVPRDLLSQWLDSDDIQDAITVDASALYRTIQPSTSLVDLYGDHQCIAPPWDKAYLGFENRHGNVIVSQMFVKDSERHGPITPADRWDTENPVDWDEVRWIVGCIIWVGGRSNTTGRAIATSGPVYMEQYAIYPDGAPADIHWTQFFDGWDANASEMHMRINLGVLNFMNCRNVDIVEPTRPRPERRRIERTGVRVHTINVFPVGKATRGSRRDGDGVPLHSVRGHFALYGPEHGRGLLFGKHAGRFFRPQHARGAADHGEIEHDYVLRADA